MFKTIEHEIFKSERCVQFITTDGIYRYCPNRSAWLVYKCSVL